MGKPLVNSKVFIFNAVVFVLAVLSLPEFISVLPVSALPYIALTGSVGNTFLRIFYPVQQPISGFFK